MTAARPDPRLALSQVDVEALRAMRTRLNKAHTSDAASATLGHAAFEVLARAGLDAASNPAGLSVMDATLGPSPSAVLDAVRGASLANLRVLLGVMRARLEASPAAWRALQTAGAPQAVISRRLQLAGREPDPNAAQ